MKKLMNTPFHQFSSVIFPCINPNPTHRPTAGQLVAHLEGLVQKSLLAIAQSMSTLEQAQLTEAAARLVGNTSDLQQVQEVALEILYRHLLSQPPHQVTEMFNNIQLHPHQPQTQQQQQQQSHPSQHQLSPHQQFFGALPVSGSHVRF
eukprot:TRINITY_DN7598_c0_g2_i2.p1 TRINITY_DN7598_c0_g2~~TRINITY_DN7598_c0_g2_i2.p1  ORF type:complete len:148 (-),score=32.27 TRINITY_DN7598_c0_g2_i2:108-551(-)